MKKNFTTAIAAFALAGLFSANMAFANDEHHPEEKKDAPKAEATASGDQGMMGNMDMHEMMNECMKMHKDGKMCEHTMMEKCESKMDKSECKKMMKDAKKDSKKKK
jgi:hypothetical protein